MSQIPAEHRATSPSALRCAVVTVSDTRTLETDTGGQAVIDRLAAAGHEVAARAIIPDEPQPMRQLLTELAARDDIDAVLLTGGTGLSGRDQTFETVSGLLTKALPEIGRASCRESGEVTQ